MNSDDFHARYRLLKCVAVADGIRTHNAQETTTGKVVMIHLLDDAGPDDVERLREALARMSFADRTRVLETATLTAGYAVVTEFLPGLVSFPAWVASRAAADGSGGDASAAPPFHPAPPPVDGPLPGDGEEGDTQALSFSVGAPEPGGKPAGEFTRLFVVGGKVQAETVPARPTPPPPPPPAAAPPPPPKEPGEFTRMFAQAAEPPRAEPRPEPPRPEPSAPLPGVVPPAVPSALPPLMPPELPPIAPPPVAPPAPAPAEPLAPGEFTRMFNTPVISSPSVGASPFVRGDAPPPPTMSPAASPASPFAGMTPGSDPRPFSAPAPPPPPLPAAAPLPPPAAPPVAPVAPPLPPPLPAMPSASPPGLSPLMGAAPATTGGSEYTRMIRQSVTPPPPAPKAPAPPKPAAAPVARSMPIGLVVTMAIVAVLTAVLILYFVFRTGAPVTPPARPTVPAAPAAPTTPNVPAAAAPRS